MQKMGMILLLLGLGIFGFFGWLSFGEFILSSDAPVLLKVAILCTLGGLTLILAFSVNG